jgi:hypothetical protein
MKHSALAVAVTVATLSVPAVAQLPNMPPIKEGLWKIHNVDSYSDSPTQDHTYSLCRSHAYDDSVRDKMKAVQAKCVTSSDTTVGNKRSMSVTCDVGGFRTSTKSVVTMSDNFYHSESESTMTSQGHSSTTKTIQEQTYMGACPAGMSPGDRKMADGSIQKHR